LSRTIGKTCQTAQLLAFNRMFSLAGHGCIGALSLSEPFWWLSGEKRFRVGTFPNPDTMLGGPRGPKRCNGRPPGILLGKKRKREVRLAHAMAEVVRGRRKPPAFAGDSLEFFQAIYRDVNQSVELRLAAARAAAAFERPSLAAIGISQTGPNLLNLVTDAGSVKFRETPLIDSAPIPMPAQDLPSSDVLRENPQNSAKNTPSRDIAQIARTQSGPDNPSTPPAPAGLDAAAARRQWEATSMSIALRAQRIRDGLPP
jgi:hypothetical protein